MNGRVLLLFLALTGLPVTSHAQFLKWGPDKTIPLAIPQAPQFGLMVKRVAFGQPGGSCASMGDELTDRIILPLFQKESIDVIEREALGQIMSELKFNQTAYADPGSAAQLGKILGPSALVIVNVDSCSPDQQHLYNNQKNWNGTITRIWISKTRFALEGSVRVVDLTTGQILGSHNFESKPEKSNQSTEGWPEFPPVDVLKDAALQQAGTDIDAMFFPSDPIRNSLFYGDKDCNMKQAYELYQNGDHAGAVQTMDNGVQQCKAGNAKEKALARAYYDAGLLHCASGDYATASPLFSSAMRIKGVEAVATTAALCEQAREGTIAVKAYREREAQIPAPKPINSSPSVSQVASASQPSPSPPTSGPSQPAKLDASSVEQRLKELEKLYKQGLITKEEYNQKRAEILKSF